MHGNRKIRDVVGEPQDAEFVSAAEAARVLFVSRRHMVRLIEAGRPPVHNGVGYTRLLRKSDVLAYKAKKEDEAEAFFETLSEDREPPGL